MFILHRTTPVQHATALSPSIGYTGQTAVDQSNGNIWVKLPNGWAQVRDGHEVDQVVQTAGAVTLKNSSGTITRSLTAVNGVVTLAATDTIVANGDSIPLQKSTGVVSSGNATLNSPATAIVSAGVASAVKAGA